MDAISDPSDPLLLATMKGIDALGWKTAATAQRRQRFSVALHF
jgi:hypothetical protein